MIKGSEKELGEPSSQKDDLVLARGSNNLKEFFKRKLSCQPHGNLDSVPR